VRYGWCRARGTPHERADGQYGCAVKVACCRSKSRSAVCDEWLAASGEKLGRDSLRWRSSDGGQSPCVLHAALAACGFSDDWQHGLVARDKRNVVARGADNLLSVAIAFGLRGAVPSNTLRNFAIIRGRTDFLRCALFPFFASGSRFLRKMFDTQGVAWHIAES